jgi:hypothetical protein
VGITNLKTGYRFVQNQNVAKSQTYVATNAQTPCCVPNQALFCYAKRSKWPCNAETSSTPKGEDVYKTHAAKDETYEQTFFCEWNDAGYVEKSKRFGDNNEKRMMEIKNNQTETTLAKCVVREERRYRPACAPSRAATQDSRTGPYAVYQHPRPLRGC